MTTKSLSFSPLSKLLAATLVLLLIVLGACGGCEPKSNRSPTPPQPADPPPTLTLLALSDLRGEIEPCGCTTDPWGDLSRTVQLAADIRAQGPTLFLDAGSTLYPHVEIAPHLVESAKLKAALIADVFRDSLDVQAVGFGGGDVAFGAAGVLLPRLTNAAFQGVPTVPYKVVSAAGHKIGVVSVLSPGAIPGLAEVPEPAGELAKYAQAARDEGAEVVVALLQSPLLRDAKQTLAATTGVDLAIVALGDEAPDPKEISRRPEQIGSTWAVFPAAKGQTMARFNLTLRPGGGPLVDAIGSDAAKLMIAAIDKDIATLVAQLEAFRADPAADPAYIALKESELPALRTRQAELRKTPLQVPVAGSYFTFDLMPISKKLACDAGVISKKTAFDKASGQANLAAAASLPPLPVPTGQATFVGATECAKCHAPAIAFWQQTRHARAWETLEEVGKQFNYDCVSCHVTGWMEPGGSTLAHNDALRDIQCETCHGPGSAHVAAGGGKGTFITLVPQQDLCAGKCHTPEHSDTFDRTAYLRDILGPGHGEAARRALGDGPTGRQLRSAGLAKAGMTLGKGCPK